jgi:hypothetical protein
MWSREERLKLQTDAARRGVQTRRRGCPERTEDGLVLQSPLQATDQGCHREER